MDEFLAKYASRYKAWTQDEQNNWHNESARGMWPFILFHGVLIWGGFCFISFSLLQINVIAEDSSKLGSVLVFTFFVWLIASMIYGYLTWKGTKLQLVLGLFCAQMTECMLHRTCLFILFYPGYQLYSFM